MTRQAPDARSWTFLVNKADLVQTQVVLGPMPDEIDLKPGQVLLAVEHFAFTANNVTYAYAGDMVGYWRFFPVPEGVDPEQWGIIPVWGFARVVRSLRVDVAEGDRFYGYLPTATHLVMEPGGLSPAGMRDVAAHRADLPGVYNSYRAAGQERGAVADEATEMLYRPLFMTSFMLDDFLAAGDFFGAQSIILTSASSKTALGLAYCLSLRPRESRPEIIGLTARERTNFTGGLGCYDRVMAYDALENLNGTEPAVVVDMAGNASVRGRIHKHFADELKQSIMVGLTHGRSEADAEVLPGPQPEFFFAPGYIAQRTAEWGSGGLEKRFAPSWEAFTEEAGGWIAVEYSVGPAALARIYETVRSGAADPATGHIVAPGLVPDTE